MRILMSLLVAIFIFGGHAVANGSECGSLEGANKGLCISYCDKLDCDSIAGRNKHEVACNVILSKYIDLTGTVPPCLKSSCTSCPVNATDALIDWFITYGKSIQHYAYHSEPEEVVCSASVQGGVTEACTTWINAPEPLQNLIVILEQGMPPYSESDISEEEARDCAQLMNILYMLLGPAL